MQTTPLWNAVYMGRVSIVDRLLKTGVYPAVPSQGMEFGPPGQVRAFIYGWPKTPLEVFIMSVIMFARHGIWQVVLYDVIYLLTGICAASVGPRL